MWFNSFKAWHQEEYQICGFKYELKNIQDLFVNIVVVSYGPNPKGLPHSTNQNQNIRSYLLWSKKEFIRLNTENQIKK